MTASPAKRLNRSRFRLGCQLVGPRKQVSVRDPGILREGAALLTEYTGACMKSDIKPVQVSCSQLLQTDERDASHHVHRVVHKGRRSNSPLTRRQRRRCDQSCSPPLPWQLVHPDIVMLLPMTLAFIHDLDNAETKEYDKYLRHYPRSIQNLLAEQTHTNRLLYTGH